MRADWEVVIGLETHAQLATKSKIFSGSAIAYGAEPNSQASPIDLGMPGMLPVLNVDAVKKAVTFGLSVSAKIADRSVFARKHYFYPDLPKGYQISQYELPIVFVILANREYRVLKHNIDAYRARFDVKSNKPYMHMDLGSPTMGFVDMAKGMGVAGTYVSKADDIKAAVEAAFKSGKPHLVEIEIEGKR